MGTGAFDAFDFGTLNLPHTYAYPMTATDLQEWLKSVSATGWEWSETNGWVSASQLRRAPALGHLFAYLLASNFIVPMQVPAALKSRRLTAT